MKISELEGLEIDFEEFVTLGGTTYFQLKDYKQYPLARWQAAEDMKHAFNLRIMPQTLDKALGEFDRLLEVAIKSEDPGARLLVGQSIGQGLQEIRKRLRMLPLPKIAYRVVANLVFTEKEDIAEPVSAIEVEERMNLFWNHKKKVLPLLFTGPMKNILKLQNYYSEDSVEKMESLLNQMIAQQLMADYFDKIAQENLLLSLGNMS